MKKLMFLVSMVAAMFAFTSCEKEAEVNTIVLDGVAYNVTPHLGCTNERLTSLMISAGLIIQPTKMQVKSATTGTMTLLATKSTNQQINIT